MGDRRCSAYSDAGGDLMRQFWRLTGKYLKIWWPGIVALAVILVTSIWLIIQFVPAGLSSAVAFIATAATVLGVSWKSVSAVLGRVLAKTESSLWSAEIREAIVKAAIRLPKGGHLPSSRPPGFERDTAGSQSETDRSPTSNAARTAHRAAAR